MRKERGAVTILTLTTVLFMLAFLISTFTIIANRRQAQAEIKMQTIETYQAEVDNIEQIYDDYFGEEGEPIPISTTEQLLNISSGKYIISNNKIYKYDSDANYQLQNDLVFSVADYLATYPNAFEEVNYIGTEISTTETVLGTYSTANTTDDPYSTFTTDYRGTYRLEVWGAQGGYYAAAYGTGGLGGYSVGTISLEAGEELYVYVGQAGGYTTATGNAVVTDGYNGGGGASYYGGTGGGATDIRFVADTWNDSTSLLSRVIVAGGGGGAQGRASASYIANGGYGGGLIGGDGSYYNGSSTTTYTGKGGTQSAGGAAGVYSKYPATDGSFGQGGTAGRYYSTTYRSSGGGGRRLVWRRRSEHIGMPAEAEVQDLFGQKIQPQMYQQDIQ